MKEVKDYLSKELKCSKDVIDQIMAKINAFIPLANDLPIVIIHELLTEDLSIVYMSEQGVKDLDMSLTQLQELKSKYYEFFFNPDDLKSYLDNWRDFAKDYNNKGTWFTFFQQVKLKNVEKYTWFLSASSVIIYDDTSHKPLFSLTISLKVNPYMPILSKLDKLISDNTFFKKNWELYHSLTKREKEIIQGMASGISIKKLADHFNMTENTIRTHRRNIKRKLNIKNEAELIQFAQIFEQN